MPSLDDVTFPVLLLTQRSGILAAASRAPLTVAPNRAFFPGAMILERSGRAWAVADYVLREEAFLSRPTLFSHFSRGWHVDSMTLELVDPIDVARIREAVVSAVHGQRSYLEGVLGVDLARFIREATDATTSTQLFDVSARLLAETAFR